MIICHCANFPQCHWLCVPLSLLTHPLLLCLWAWVSAVLPRHHSPGKAFSSIMTGSSWAGAGFRPRACRLLPASPISAVWGGAHTVIRECWWRGSFLPVQFRGGGTVEPRAIDGWLKDDFRDVDSLWITEFFCAFSEYWLHPHPKQLPAISRCGRGTRWGLAMCCGGGCGWMVIVTQGLTLGWGYRNREASSL